MYITPIGFASMSVPVYIAEAAPAQIRGSLVTFNQLFITVGILISSVVAGAFSSDEINGWRYAHSTYRLLQIIYNYRLLMRSTHDHEDRVRYWLTDAEGGGQPILDKVFMVMSRPKSKVYYCFIKLSGIFLHKDGNIHSYCFLSRPLS